MRKYLSALALLALAPAAYACCGGGNDVMLKLDPILWWFRALFTGTF